MTVTGAGEGEVAAPFASPHNPASAGALIIDGSGGLLIVNPTFRRIGRS
jgi:hypothetical protein